MPLDFPSSPSLNQIHTFGTKSWSWNGYAWVSLGISGASASIDIQSTNSSSTFYPLFTSGTGNTAIYIDPTVTPFTYIPSSGTINARILGLSAPNGKINISSLTGILQTIFDTEILNWSTNPPELSHTGLLTFQLKSLIGLTLSSPIITFGNGINDLYTFPGYTGQTGNALLARENGQLYWGAVSNSIDTYVRTFNGRTGDVEGVTSINGATGAISNVAFTNNGNTFSVLQFMNAGISASGGITTDTLNIISGFTANGVTGTIGTLIAFTGISASQLTGVSGALYATSTTNTLDVISTVDGAGLRIAQSADPNSSSARVGSIRLGKSVTPTSNVLLHGAAGVFNFYNGISNTYSSMLSISASTLTIGSSNVSGATFSGLAKFTAGISSAGATFSGSLISTAGATFSGSLISTAGATFSGTVPSRIYSGICGSGGITLANLFVAGGGATIMSQNGALNLYKGSGTTPSSLNFDASSIKLNFNDGDGTPQVLTLIPDTIQSSTQTFPSQTGTLLNTVTGVVSINGSSGVISNVARMNEGNTFTTRQVMNAGISAQSGMTLSGRFNFYSGICGAGGITLGSQVNAPIGISAGGITSDTGYKITSSAINTQTSSYILTSDDNGKIITMDAGTGITLTVPTGLPVGHTTTIVRLGAGNVGISAANGVTINSFQNQVNIAGQHAAVSLISYSSNIFNLAGGLTG